MPGCYFDRVRPWSAIGLSVALHLVVIVALTWRPHASESHGGSIDMSGVDIEVAPAAPQAEVLPAEEVAMASETPTMPPEEPPAPPAETGDLALDAGVAAPDAAPAVHHHHHADAGVATVSSDAGSEATPDAGTAVATTKPPSAGTAADLLDYFPHGQIVTVLIRFDRLRGTEWARTVQDVLSLMPDYETLVRDPDTVLADKLDLAVVSTPQPSDPKVTTLAFEPTMTPAEVRDFLGGPGAPIEWSRVAGGVAGKRGAGKRVGKGDPRVFVEPSARWVVLATPRDLGAMLDPASGDLDGATADPAKTPAWVARLPDLEAASGDPDGPALMMTMAPRDKTWDVPDVGIGVTSIPAPEHVTLSLELDKQGFVVKGNLGFGTEDEAKTFVDTILAARKTALDTALIKALLSRANAINAVTGLSLARTGRRVSYATSISIADARTLFAAGELLVTDYFHQLQDAAKGDDP